MQYTIQHFINKFEAIAENRIIEGYQTQLDFKNKAINHCAYGWCQHNPFFNHGQDGDLTAEGISLKKILSSLPNLTAKPGNSVANPYREIPARINNGDVQQYQQPTPKARILAALYDCKANEALKQATQIISNQNTMTPKISKELTNDEYDLLTEEVSKNPAFPDNRDEFENRSGEEEDFKNWSDNHEALNNLRANGYY